MERKRNAFPETYRFRTLASFKTLTEMTEYFVLRYTEYDDLATYLRGYAITGDYLAQLSVPSLMLLADDDPVIPIAGVADLRASPALSMYRTQHGGHCGFIEDYSLSSWLDDFLLTQIEVSGGDY